MLRDDPPAFFLSTPHECSYLREETATTLLVDPRAKLTPTEYNRLIAHGFRRSGSLVYRPHCGTCQACVPVRVDVQQFAITRSQRRVRNRNQDLLVKQTSPNFTDEYFELYCRYQHTRHAGGSMDDPDPDKFRDFLVTSTVDTVFFEMRLKDKLVCIAVADRLDAGLSAIYTYFDPELSRRSLGTYAILWEIEHARSQGFQWLYLGYWIENCQKMSYKADFAPTDAFQDGKWRTLDAR